jgi:hypothetical protein
VSESLMNVLTTVRISTVAMNAYQTVSPFPVVLGFGPHRSRRQARQPQQQRQASNNERTDTTHPGRGRGRRVGGWRNVEHGRLFWTMWPTGNHDSEP